MVKQNDDLQAQKPNSDYELGTPVEYSTAAYTPADTGKCLFSHKNTFRFK